MVELSPLAVHFPANSQPTPSPILTSTSQSVTPMLQGQAQPSPSPHLVTNMNHLSVLPASPAMFALPASSLMPPPTRSQLILPSQHTQNLVHTPRQLSISQQPGQAQKQQQTKQTAIAAAAAAGQSSIQHHISIQPSLAPSTLKPTGSVGSTAPVLLAPAPSTPSLVGQENGSVPSSTEKPTSAAPNTSKVALAPVTPASLMNLSGSESTPTSSPKFSANTKSRSLLAKPNNSNGGKSANSKPSGSRRIGNKRHSSGGIVTAGTLAPRTPGTPALISPIPIPPGASGGFTALISPALKPTLMPQPPISHRGSISAQPILVSPRSQPILVSPSLKPWLPGGLSYNTDLHSGIELRRTSHKAAEQKRRDSLKHCFDDLRQMIPNIVDKAPSKVFLLKKSFDYICSLKSEIAQRDLHMARTQAQEDHFKSSLESWLATTFQGGNSATEEGSSNGGGGGGGGGGGNGAIAMPDMTSWRLSEEELDKITMKQLQAVKVAQEMSELSAAAVEAARIGNQQNGGNKDGKNGSSSKRSGGNGNGGGGGGGGNGGGNGASRYQPNSSNSSIREEINGDDSDDEDSGARGGYSAQDNDAMSSTGSKDKKPGQPKGVPVRIANNTFVEGTSVDSSGDVEMSGPDEQQDQASIPPSISGTSAGTDSSTMARSCSRTAKGGQEAGEEEEEEDEYEEGDSDENEDDDDDGEEDEM
ncbi:hypothetical protein BGZ79_002574 [Entomortierella chlamydospora]|nr:hypothetical protein BGZ79_002574 [Entomortierella chlamydospora]